VPELHHIETDSESPRKRLCSVDVSITPESDTYLSLDLAGEIVVEKKWEGEKGYNVKLEHRER
jgi:hypothetical protein